MPARPRLPLVHGLLAALCLLASPVAESAAPPQPFFIQILDEATQRGVPLVELSTVHELRFVTDNAGMVAVRAPELMGQRVFFHIASHGYQFPQDGFGYAGKPLEVRPGETVTLEIKRENIAERLYRVTGAGLYAHAAQAGQKPPVREPLLAQQVVGCDSVLNAVYQGKLFWIWGDTSRIGYPLGNFDATAATSLLPGQGGLSPSQGVDFHYFTNDKGFVKGIAPMEGQGPTWLSALVTLPDAQGNERLCATYVKIRGFLEVYERGLCVFDPGSEVFQKIHEFPSLDGLYPDGHVCLREGHAYAGQAVPHLRFPASYEAWQDPSSYTSVNADVAFVDVATDQGIRPHHGHCAWNAHRDRWVSLFSGHPSGNSHLGEVWYAEAARPEGPWQIGRAHV